MVRAHYPLVDLSRLERGYPKEVGPQEADNLRAGLLDLSSTVIGDINLCGTATPLDQLGSDRSARELSGGVYCRRWAVDTCGLHQPGAGGPDPFVRAARPGG